jgi:hypothetical protein
MDMAITKNAIIMAAFSVLIFQQPLASTGLPQICLAESER